MIKALGIGLTAVAAQTNITTIDTTVVEEAAGARGRELFPGFAVKRARRAGLNGRDRAAARMAVGDASKTPASPLEMLAQNDAMDTTVSAGSRCSRRNALARAAGLAAGLTAAQVNTAAFAAQTKMVKMGSDAGQLVFVPDEVTICKGDSVTWTNNKGGPHNVVFDEDEIPSGVKQEDISMDTQLGEEGETFSKKFDVAGTYNYYCEPHRGAGMNAVLIVE